MPPARERLRERGYNQSHELARALARRFLLACDAGLLLRLGDTAHQPQLPPERRAANVRQTLAVEQRRARELRGRHVALLDDAMTIGATQFELARALRQARAWRVEAWVAARIAD